MTEAEWRERLTHQPKDCYTTGMGAEHRYREAMQRLLPKIHAAHLASSKPAPHPVRWKRWLRRPYRKGDPALLLHELRKIRP